MGFLDYYDSSELVNEKYGAGNNLADNKKDVFIMVPKNIWHLPGWNKGFYKVYNYNLHRVENSINNIERVISNTANFTEDEISKLLKSIHVYKAQLYTSWKKFKEYMDLDATELKAKEDEITQFYEKHYIPLSQLLSNTIINDINSSNISSADRHQMLSELNKLSSDIKKEGDLFRQYFNQALYPSQSKPSQAVVSYNDEIMGNIQDIDDKIKYFKSIIMSNKPYDANKIDTDKDVANQLKIISSELKSILSNIENDTNVSDIEKQMFNYIVGDAIDRAKSNYNAITKHFKTAKPVDVEQPPVDDVEQNVEPKSQLTADEIKAELAKRREEKKTKPLYNVRLSPEKRQEMANKRIKRKIMTNSYNFMEHYFTNDEIPLYMDLNEDSPYMMGKVLQKVTKGIGDRIGGLASAFLSNLGRKTPKTAYVDADGMGKYFSDGRFFYVPYGGYVATNAACAQSLSEFVVLKQQQGMLAAKVIASKFSLVVGREGVEVDDDPEAVKQVLSQYYRFDESVTGVMVIEGTLWRTSNKGVVFAASVLINPDEDDEKTAENKSNVHVQIDQDERQDVMFFVGCDNKGEKFFIDTFNMSMRQYLQNVKSASGQTISAQTSKIHQKFSDMGLTDIKASTKKMFQKITNEQEFSKIYNNFRSWVDSNKNSVKVQQINRQNAQGGIYTITIKGVTGQAMLYGEATPKGNVFKIKFTPELSELFATIDPNGIDKYKQL